MKFIGKILVLASVFLSLAGGAYFFFISLLPKTKETSQLTAQRDALEAEVSALKAEVEGYRTKQDRFATDSAFVERVARQNGRSTPNEIVFVFE